VARRRQVTGRKGNMAERGATVETYGPKGIPRPREARSQEGQLEESEAHGFRKDVKVPIKRKLT